MVRNEPDLDLIKQVEQVTIPGLERPAGRFAAIPSDGMTEAVEVVVFLIWQLLHWLLFGCINSQERPRAIYLRGGSLARLPASLGGSANRQVGCRAVAPPNSPRPLHNCEIRVN
jgi:hypothetical protein